MSTIQSMVEAHDKAWYYLASNDAKNIAEKLRNREQIMWPTTEELIFIMECLKDYFESLQEGNH